MNPAKSAVYDWCREGPVLVHFATFLRGNAWQEWRRTAELSLAESFLFIEQLWTTALSADDHIETSILGGKMPEYGRRNKEYRMLIAMENSDFSDQISASPPGGLRLSDSEVAPVAVLEALRSLAASIGTEFTPPAWLFVEDGEVVGICSIVKPRVEGAIEIGYGVAPTRQGKGATFWLCFIP